MKPSRNELMDAICEGDIEKIRLLVSQGADLNEFDSGDSLLSESMLELCAVDKEFRYEVAKALLELGAEPNLLDDDRGSPMNCPMMRMDTEMLRIFLEAGADPNLSRGFSADESLYDYAKWEYLLYVFGELPESPSDKDRKSEDAWLLFLDRLAVKYEKRRPDHLFLLRKHGALTMTEIKRKPKP